MVVVKYHDPKSLIERTEIVRGQDIIYYRDGTVAPFK